MDWSSLYEDSGEEISDEWIELLHSEKDELVKFVSNKGKYTVYVAYLFTVNYILGVGSLGMPYAFYNAGILLSITLIICVTLLSLSTVMWVAETVCRAEFMATLPCECGSKFWLCVKSHNPLDGNSNNHNHKHNHNHNSNSNSNSSDNIKQQQHRQEKSNENSSLLKKSLYNNNHDTYQQLSKLNNSNHNHNRNHNHNHNSKSIGDSEGTVDSSMGKDGENKDNEKCYEVLQLCYKFMGKRMKLCYQLSLSTLMYTGLVAYTQVFLQSIDQQIPMLSQHLPQGMLILFFSLFVIPLSCTDLVEQVSVQVIMAICRFASLALMAIGSLIGLFSSNQEPFEMMMNNNSSSSSSSSSQEYHDNQYNDYFDNINNNINNNNNNNNLVMTDFTGFGLMFSTALFSQLFQHSVPGLMQPLSKEDKKKTRQVFTGALATTLFFYILIGISGTMYFGARLQPSFNLNFDHFHWGIHDLAHATWMTKGIVWLLSKIVVLFPAIDTLSIFPLIANTLGNNLAVSSPGLRLHLKRKYKFVIRKQSWLIIWRLVASVPPLLLCMVLNDLSMTLMIAGFFGLFVAFVTPALLQRSSMLACERQFGTSQTMFSGHFSKLIYTKIILFFSFFAACVLLFQIFNKISG